MIELRNCPICQGQEWQSLDEYRNHRYWYDRDLRFKDPVGFKICKKCAFSTYDYIDDYNEMYNNERKAVSINNIITGRRKIKYHDIFLKDIDKHIDSIGSWLDVGCAQGTFIDYINGKFDLNGNVYGSEFSEICRKFAKNYYGLDNIKNNWRDFEEKKYDVISYYHVLEHIPHPNKELQDIKERLSDNGLLYIAVPHWYGSLYDACGQGTFDFENLFHVNHINAWTIQGLKNLLHSNGLEIVKENDVLYGYMVLCKKSENKDIVLEDYKEKIEILKKQRQAIELFNQKKFEEAIKVYPNYPEAYLHWAGTLEKVKDRKAQMDILGLGYKNCNEDINIYNHIATIKKQWYEDGGGTNSILEAKEMFEKSLSEKFNDNAMFNLALIEGQYLKNYKKAIEYLEQLMWVNPAGTVDYSNLIFKFSTM